MGSPSFWNPLALFLQEWLSIFSFFSLSNKVSSFLNLVPFICYWCWVYAAVSRSLEVTVLILNLSCQLKEFTEL